jgi:hypothetical protein
MKTTINNPAMAAVEINETTAALAEKIFRALVNSKFPKDAFNVQACARHAAEKFLGASVIDGDIRCHIRNVAKTWEKFIGTEPMRITGGGTPWETAAQRGSMITWTLSYAGEEEMISSYCPESISRLRFTLTPSQPVEGVMTDDGFIPSAEPVTVRPFMDIGIVSPVTV